MTAYQLRLACAVLKRALLDWCSPQPQGGARCLNKWRISIAHMLVLIVQVGTGTGSMVGQWNGWRWQNISATYCYKVTHTHARTQTHKEQIGCFKCFLITNRCPQLHSPMLTPSSTGMQSPSSPPVLPFWSWLISANVTERKGDQTTAASHFIIQRGRLQKVLWRL